MGGGQWNAKKNKKVVKYTVPRDDVTAKNLFKPHPTSITLPVLLIIFCGELNALLLAMPC